MDFLESAVNYLNFHELGSVESHDRLADAATSIAYSLAGILEYLTSCPVCEGDMGDIEWGWEPDSE